MKAFVDPLFLYLFVFALLYLRIPDVNNDHYINHKIMLFFGLLMFDFALQLIKKIRSKCIIKTNELFTSSITTSLIGVLGYSLYVDMSIMEYTRDYIKCHSCSFGKKIAIITVLIVALISLVKLVETVVTVDEPDCL